LISGLDVWTWAYCFIVYICFRCFVAQLSHWCCEVIVCGILTLSTTFQVACTAFSSWSWTVHI
jgi:hypothetical protein